MVKALEICLRKDIFKYKATYGFFHTDVKQELYLTNYIADNSTCIESI